MSTHDRTNQPASRRPPAHGAAIPRYEIRVDGHLGRRWEAWFDGLTLRNEDDGTSVLSGPIVDQAALHGVLQKLRDLGITLRSLTELDPTQIESNTGHARHQPPGAPS